MKQNDLQNQFFETEVMEYYLSPPTPVELIGYAKNNIVEALNSNKNISPVDAEKLKEILTSLSEIQEHFFDS